MVALFGVLIVVGEGIGSRLETGVRGASLRLATIPRLATGPSLATGPHISNIPDLQILRVW